MATRVKVRQEFEAAPGSVTPPPLQACLVGPLHRSVRRAEAGQYDTTDTTETCFALPGAVTTADPRIQRYEEVYGDSSFTNARHLHLTVDGEQNLASIQDNRDAYRFFRESYEDRPEVSEAQGGWENDGIFSTFHGELVPGSVVVAREQAKTITLADDDTSETGTQYHLKTSDFPVVNDTGGTVLADGVIAGTMQLVHPNNDAVVYTEGLDWELTYEYGWSNPDAVASATRWRITLPSTSQLSAGDQVKLKFEGKFPLKYGTGLDIEPDYVNGSLQNKLGAGEEIDDAIFYYSFWPIVSVAAFLQERATGALTQLDATDYTIKTVNGVANQLCLRTGLQGALLGGDGFTVGTRIDEGNYVCGTASETFCINDACDADDPKDTLRFCVFRGASMGSPITEDIVLNSGSAVTAQDVADDINNNATVNDYVVAYVSNGKLCIRLRDPSFGDGTDEISTFDMRGADNYFEIKPVDRDVAPILGLPYGKVCGVSRYPLTDEGTNFQDAQDSCSCIIGSVLIDKDNNRYLIDGITSDNVIEVSEVDADNVLVCGTLTAPNGQDEYGIYYANWSATVLASYVAVRNTEGETITQVNNGSTDLVAKLSEDGTQNNFSLGPENPLGYAGSKFFFSNTQGSGLFLAVNSDDLAGYQTAIEALELDEDVHLIVPLTFDDDVHSAIDAHVQEFSYPDAAVDEPMTRMGVYAKLSENVTVLGDTANDGAEVRFSANPAARTWSDATVDPSGFEAATGKAKVFQLSEGDDSTVNFVTDGVRSGDRLRIHFGANQGDWRITRVITTNGGLNSHQLQATAIETNQYFVFDTDHAENLDPSSPTGTNQNGLVAYTIYRPLTKEAWKDELTELSAEFRGSAFPYRAIVTWGPLFIDDATPDGRSATLPGFYLNAGLAGGASAAVVQQGFTNYPLAGTSDVRFTRGYFNGRQLDEIEAGGVWIWQTKRGQNFYSAREQYTVDGYLAVNVLSSQFHIIRIADRMHRRYYEALIGFTGIFNITEENIAIFRMAVQSAIEAAKATSAPRVGPEIKNGYVADIRCDPNNPRTLLLVTRNIPPEAVDVFDITNQVRRG